MTYRVVLAGLVDVEVGERLEILDDELLDGLGVAGVVLLEEACEVAHARLVVMVAQQQWVVRRLPQVHEEAHTGLVALRLRQAHGDLKMVEVEIELCWLSSK